MAVSRASAAAIATAAGTKGATITRASTIFALQGDTDWGSRVASSLTKGGLVIPKLTLDGGLLREHVLHAAIKTLKSWEAEGRIELFESDRAKESPIPKTIGWPGAPTPHRFQSRFRAPKKSESGGPSFQVISSVIFPGRDPQRLAMTEINDVAHLVRHHSLGHAIFVTNNVEGFIAKGKREYLQAKFQIVILTPDETVLVLEKLEGFDRESPRAQAAHE